MTQFRSVRASVGAASFHFHRVVYVDEHDTESESSLLRVMSMILLSPSRILLFSTRFRGQEGYEKGAGHLNFYSSQK